METGSYPFRLGQFECLSVSDGSHSYAPESFFQEPPRESVEAELRRWELPPDKITTPYTYLLVKTEEGRVLVDMGAGRMTEATGRMVANLRAAGLDPTDVDAVFITHAHPDHIGGTLDEQGNLVFANAHYYIWRGEWDFWLSDEETANVRPPWVKAARRALEPMRGRITLIEAEGEILAGVGVLAAPGHTPGHMVVSFSSRGEQLYYIGDTVLHHLHLEHPDWTPAYDLLPGPAEASKRRIFDLAAESRAWVIGQHFIPFPSLGHVIAEGAGWRWDPIRIQA